MKPLCLFHDQCDDGFAAAWVVRRALGDVELKAVEYKNPPPDVIGRDVIIVDFSYKRPAMAKLMSDANSLLVLDHHKTAAQELGGFPVPEGVWAEHVQGRRTGIEFDMSRSGAGLTWDYFYPGQHRPLFIDYIEDRDLWRKSLEGIDEFTFALRSYPRDFDVWDKLVGLGVGQLIEDGKPIKRFYNERVAEMLHDAYDANIVAYDKPPIPCRIANVPKVFASEVAGALSLEASSIGATFYQHADCRWEYSLRSRSGVDVSAIAKWYGGGGHAAAAGFTVSNLVHLPCAGTTPIMTTGIP